jgi:Virulence protein
MNKHSVDKSGSRNGTEEFEGNGMDINKEYGLTPCETREVLFYDTDDGEVRVEILLYHENLWLTQAIMR